MSTPPTEAAPTNHQETHVSITSTGAARTPAIPFHTITLIVAGVDALMLASAAKRLLGELHQLH